MIDLEVDTEPFFCELSSEVNATNASLARKGKYTTTWHDGTHLDLRRRGHHAPRHQTGGNTKTATKQRPARQFARFDFWQSPSPIDR
jgi:hypothetical protein